MERIDYKGGYLYCNVEITKDIISNYDSSEDCFNDYKEDIIKECINRSYTDKETDRVLNHYEIKINNL